MVIAGRCILARCACDAEQNFRFCRLQTTILILILRFQEMVTPGPACDCGLMVNGAWYSVLIANFG